MVRAQAQGVAAVDLERARQQLYQSAAAAYLGLYLAQQQARIRLEQVDVTAARIKELQARADIGRSRPGDRDRRNPRRRSGHCGKRRGA